MFYHFILECPCLIPKLTLTSLFSSSLPTFNNRTENRKNMEREREPKKKSKNSEVDTTWVREDCNLISKHKTKLVTFLYNFALVDSLALSSSATASMNSSVFRYWDLATLYKDESFEYKSKLSKAAEFCKEISFWQKLLGPMNKKCKILSHLPWFDSSNTSCFQFLCKIHKSGIAVQLCPDNIDLQKIYPMISIIRKKFHS